MILIYKSKYQSKDELKFASKKLINCLKPIIRSGTMVANEKQKDDRDSYYLTKLNLNFNNGNIDFLTAKESLNIFSNKWKWTFSSAHTKGFITTVEETTIEFTFIDTYYDEEDSILELNFFIISSSELDAQDKIKIFVNEILINYQIRSVQAYFKLDNCYIVKVSTKLLNNNIEGVRNLLMSIVNEWNIVGLEAYAKECLVDENITTMSANFKETKF